MQIKFTTNFSCQLKPTPLYSRSAITFYYQLIRVKDNLKTNGNILAFDFGEKKIGGAVGNSITKSAHPLIQ